MIKKNGLTWADAVAFGIGHGGVESILLVGLSQISNVVTSILIQTGKVKALKMSTLEKLCDALDCQPGDILEFKKDENADERFNDSKYL